MEPRGGTASYDKDNDSAELCTTLHLAGSLTGSTCN